MKEETQDISINPRLVWDYEIPADASSNEGFKRWYIARALSRGSAQDIREIGMATIRSYFPELNLPGKIRSFWEWYFSLADVEQRYERDIDSVPESSTTRDRGQPT